LAKARDAAADARALIRDRKDPIEHRKEQRTAAKVEASRAVTFKQYAEQFISGREGYWKNPRRRQAWRNSLQDYDAAAMPVIFINRYAAPDGLVSAGPPEVPLLPGDWKRHDS
jgi:hypothetical protein